MHITQDIDERFRKDAVRLYDEAFAQKFSIAVPDQADRFRLFEKSFDLSFALGAIEDDQLVALAGYKTIEGALTSGVTFDVLRESLGIVKALRAAAIFTLYDRPLASGVFLMDGLCVDSSQRGKGVGTLLLDHIKALAHQRGYQSVRLDVIETNPKAKKLYQKQGFVVTTTQTYGFLKPILGFGGHDTMIYVGETSN